MLFCNHSFLGCYGDKAYAVPFLLTLSCSRSNTTVSSALDNLFVCVITASSDLYYLRCESFSRYVCLELIHFYSMFISFYFMCSLLGNFLKHWENRFAKYVFSPKCVSCQSSLFQILNAILSNVILCTQNHR